ncbi:MAG: hypothetical protein U9R34_01430 [Nanoarchaeota archaeon]|nr:hypothetical protein [Nanoarchaeota archaeon]
MDKVTNNFMMEHLPPECKSTYYKKESFTRFLQGYDKQILFLNPDGAHGIEKILDIYNIKEGGIYDNFFAKQNSNLAKDHLNSRLSDLKNKLNEKISYVKSIDEVYSALDSNKEYAFVLTGVIGEEIGTDDHTSKSGNRFLAELDKRNQLTYVFTESAAFSTHKTISELPNIFAYTAYPGDNVMMYLLYHFLDGKDSLEQISNLKRKKQLQDKANARLDAVITHDFLPDASFDEVKGLFG